MARWTIDGPRQLSFDEQVDRVDVSLIAGRVNVVGTDGPARLEATKVGRKPLIVELVDGVLRLRHEEPPRWPGAVWWLGQMGRRYYAEVSLAVPHAVASRLRVISGSVVASGLRGDTTTNVTSGRITLLGLDGRISAAVVSGTIEALGVRGDLTMESTSGEITLADSSAGRVHARAVSGTLTCDLDNPYGSDIQLETVSGEITVRVREDSDLDVHLRATSGRVSSSFQQLCPERHIAGQHTAHGRLGAGTGRLSATAISGNIALLARPVENEEPS